MPESKGSQATSGIIDGPPAPLSKGERDKRLRLERALSRLERLLLKLGEQGLQRMSRSSLTELKAMTQTAHNAGLIKIERLLEALATDVERYIDRDPLFKLGRYMGLLNQIWLLLGATAERFGAGEGLESLRELLGEARRKYDEVESRLTMQPLGASGWVTDTGFVGVTIYMAIRERPGEVFQVTSAKPTLYFGDDPRSLLRQHVSDYQPYTLYDFSHGAYAFVKAKLSSDNRLSIHRDLEISPAPYIGIEAYREFAASRWSDLVERIRVQELSPLTGLGTLLAYVEPSGYGELVEDQKRGRVQAHMFDDKGASMIMEVALRRENNHLIDNLESMLSDNSRFPIPQGLFGRVRLGGGRLKFFPLTAMYASPIAVNRPVGQKVQEVHLSLETVRGGRAQRSDSKRRRG